MQQWYCHVQGQQYGPVTREQLAQWLRDGRIGSGTYVWREGMAEWAPLSAVAELRGVTGASVPPLPARPPIQRSYAPYGYAPVAMPPPGPRTPEVLKVGVALYILSFVAGVVSAIVTPAPPDLSEQEAMAAACIALPLAMLILGLDILGMVMACLGRAWGAVILICTTAFALVLTGIVLLVAEPGSVWAQYNAFDVLGLLLAVLSMVCFIVPGAWSFYRESEAHRRGRWA
jgi:hypothetical protein